MIQASAAAISANPNEPTTHKQENNSPKMREKKTSLPEDETVRSLRRACDRYFHELGAGHAFEGLQQLPSDLIREIFASLPNNVLRRVSLPAAVPVTAYRDR
jgi:hypothetical protein